MNNRNFFRRSWQVTFALSMSLVLAPVYADEALRLPVKVELSQVSESVLYINATCELFSRMKQGRADGRDPDAIGQVAGGEFFFTFSDEGRRAANTYLAATIQQGRLPKEAATAELFADAKGGAFSGEIQVPMYPNRQDAFEIWTEGECVLLVQGTPLEDTNLTQAQDCSIGRPPREKSRAHCVWPGTDWGAVQFYRLDFEYED